MPEGRDVSDNNRGWSARDSASFDFVIFQAVNEHGNVEHSWPGYYDDAAHLTLRGVYGWPIAGRDNHALGVLLGRFAADAEIGAWADYERGGRAAMPSVPDLLDYLRGIASMGVVAGFYCNRSDYPRDPALDVFPLWAANPSGLTFPRTPSITQYGIVDGVDADRATDAALAALRRYPAPPTPGDSEMLVVTTGQITPGVVVAYLCQGGRRIATYTGAAGAYGIPQAAIDFAAKWNVPLQVVTPADLTLASTP